MKTFFAITAACAILAGIFGFATWEPSMGGFDVATTTIMSALGGTVLGAIIATVAIGAMKLICKN